MKAKEINSSDGKWKQVLIDCPGCKCSHVLTVINPNGNPQWGFNDDYEKPTFTPSLLVRWDEGEEHIQKTCHSFIREGKIQFLGDCTHELANQEVDLPDLDSDEELPL